MENLHMSASQINVMLEGCNVELLEKDVAIEIINNPNSLMVHYASGEYYNRNFYLLNGLLYVAVVLKDLSNYDFYKIVKL